MLETLRFNLLVTAAAFAAATGINPPSIGKLALNDHGFFRRVEAEEGFTVKTYDRVMNWFNAEWPENLAWPDDVPRPRTRAVDQAASHAA